MTTIEPAIEPAIDVYPCSVCGREFHSKMARQGHMTSHRTPIPCPECGKQYRTSGALGNHRKNTHDVPSMNSQSKQGRPKTDRTNLDWTTDDLLSVVIEALWPDGSIPSTVVLPLIQWRETTREFLEKVRSNE